MKCKKCGRDLKFSNHLKGTAIEQQKICVYCGCKNNEKYNPKRKLAFKDTLMDQLNNIGKVTEKVLNDATAPLSKMEEDWKKFE